METKIPDITQAYLREMINTYGAGFYLIDEQRASRVIEEIMAAIEVYALKKSMDACDKILN